MEKKTGIVWLREDLRIKNNRALSYATSNHETVCAIYVFKKNDFASREAQKWWLYKSLVDLEKSLKELNISLEIIKTSTYDEFFNEIIKKKFFSIYWNKIYEPKFLNFDNKISKKLTSNNINFKFFKGNVLNEYTAVKKSDNTPFKVFTPFWKNAEQIYLQNEFLNNFPVKKKSKKILFLKNKDKFVDILPKKKWFKKFEKTWSPSEKEAIKVCKNFVETKISNYGNLRDIPGVDGTSKISPFLAFGQINVETIWKECNKIRNKQIGYRKYINELGWREFSYSLINYFPQMLKGNLRKEFDNFPWIENKKYLKAWKDGMTGYPIVDAGMRELYETGWMHNRVRMVTASFLVKHLRINWKEGEKHFRNCLLDFNEASNISGWQWVSGCGADAAPYFRIFNPILQGERFDKHGEYVKKWIPELKNVPQEYIHKPWELNEKINNLELGKNYPMPIVNHQNAREAALNAFKKIKK